MERPGQGEVVLTVDGLRLHAGVEAVHHVRREGALTWQVERLGAAQGSGRQRQVLQLFHVIRQRQRDKQ